MGGEPSLLKRANTVRSLRLANQLILDTQKFCSSFFKSLQGRGTESLVGFKGEALNFSCPLRGERSSPLNIF